MTGLAGRLPTVAVSVRAGEVDGRLRALAGRTGVVAAEVTFTPSGVGAAVRFARRLRDGVAVVGGGEIRRREVRFHAKAMPAFDVGAPGEEGEQARAQLLKAVEAIADGYGPTHLTVHSLVDLEGDAVRVPIERLRAVREHAAAHGVALCLENLASGWTADPRNLVAAVEGAGVSLTLDVGHVNSCEGCRRGRYTRRAFIEAVGEFIVAAHLYEYEESGHQRDGDCSLTWDAMEALLVTNADWWVIELEEEGQFVSMLDEVVGFLDHVRGEAVAEAKKRALGVRGATE